MTKVLVSDQYLGDIANAIRSKKSVNTTYTPAEMANTILSIPTGSGQINLQNKTITPTESQQTVNCDNNYDGLDTVTVNAIDSTYVGTGVNRQAAQTITPSTSNQTIAANTYLTGTQTIAGDADLTTANIKHGVNIFGTTGTFGTKVDSVTVTPSSRELSITFTGLKAQPLAFCCTQEGQTTFSKSYRWIVSVSYDGTTVRNETHGVSGSSMIGYTFTNCTWSYSNGSLTITSPSSGANGYFKDSMLHRLMYIYEE